MKGIIINIRNGIDSHSGKAMKRSQNVLIAMLEELVSAKSVAEKKRILADEYGMIMTAELEGRMQIMCNWSEGIIESLTESITKRERIDAVRRMIKANATKDQIISFGYTEAEYTEAEYKKEEEALYENA